jgi:hypothetical protein
MATPINGSAQDQVNEIIDKDASKGRVPVHVFDPSSTPQEKGAAAGEGRDELKSVGDQSSPVERGRFSPRHISNSLNVLPEQS